MASLRTILAKFFLGINLEDIRDYSFDISKLKTATEIHEQVLHDIITAIELLTKESKGLGWTNTVQEAIMNLSVKLESHTEVLMEHQNVIESILILEDGDLPNDSTNDDDDPKLN